MMIKQVLRSVTLAGLVVLSVFTSLLIGSPARAELFQPRQQWLRDSTAGLFLHWGMRTAPGYFDCAEWEKAVTDGGWDPNYWVEEGLKLHTQYLVLASFHSRLGYARAWPSAIPGTCSTKRDFLGELIAAAKPKGLKVILYMTDDPQWYWEGWQPTRPPDPTDPADLAKPSWMDSAAYSAYTGKPVNLHTRPGFGEFSYDNFVEVMHNYRDLAGFWIDNDNEFWEANGLYERIRAERPDMTLSNNNEDTPIMDMVSHEQKVGMTPAYDYPQAVWTPMPRLTEGEWKLPTTGNWWYDGHDGPVDYPVTLGRIVSNSGSSIKSLMAETAMVNGRFPPKQAEFNNFASDYLDEIWPTIHGVEGGGYMYGGLKPGFWNDGAHGVTTVSTTDPDLHYVHVLTKPDTATSITLGDNDYRVKRVTNVRTGAAMAFSQSGGSLTIDGITSWDTYDTVFKVETAGRLGFYPPGRTPITATATTSASGLPASNLVDGDYLSYWDSNTTLPVSITLDQGLPKPLSYLAINQREWSPTYNRVTFGRPEDSARIKDFKVYVSSDGANWGDPIVTGTMPSVRGVQYLELGRADVAGSDHRADVWSRFVKLEVDNTWAAASAPNYYQKLRIDEMSLGWGHASAVAPGTVVMHEVEDGRTRGSAHVVACQTCSGGAKVVSIGGSPSNDVTVKVPARGGLYLLTIVGAVAGTRSFSVSVNGWPATSLPMTGSSNTSPLIARSIPVLLLPGANTVRLFNVSGAAPDLDKITVSPLWP
jgi:alpha-L-fucosidase